MRITTAMIIQSTWIMLILITQSTFVWNLMSVSTGGYIYGAQGGSCVFVLWFLLKDSTRVFWWFFVEEVVELSDCNNNNQKFCPDPAAAV